MRCTSLLVIVVALAGCGPGAGDPPPQTCGGDTPVRVVEGVGVGVATYAGDRIFAYAGAVPSWDVERIPAMAVGGCGEDPSAIGEVDFLGALSYGVAGPHTVRHQHQGSLSWVDAYGEAPSHPLFTDMVGCVLPVAEGLVAQTADGAVWFHPEPARADVAPRMLVRRSVLDEFPYTPYFDLTDCSLSGSERPVLDGDGILVAEEDGPLVRIALPSGDRNVLVEGAVEEFVLLPDPRYLLWRGALASSPETDEWDIHVLDRRAGTSEKIASGDIVGNVDWEGAWLSTYSVGWNAREPTETFYNYETGQLIEIDDWWDLQAAVSPTDLLLERIGEGDMNILDVITGVLHPVDFPPLAWPERTYDDGLVAQRLADTDTDTDEPRGDLLRLRFGSREPELLVADVPSNWVRTHGGNLLFIDREDPDELGPLVLVELDGERRELAANVSTFSVPHHATDRERNEVIYFVGEGADRGMWRFVLP